MPRMPTVKRGENRIFAEDPEFFVSQAIEPLKGLLTRDGVNCLNRASAIGRLKGNPNSTRTGSYEPAMFGVGEPQVCNHVGMAGRGRQDRGQPRPCRSP